MCQVSLAAFFLEDYSMSYCNFPVGSWTYRFRNTIFLCSMRIYPVISIKNVKNYCAIQGEIQKSISSEFHYNGLDLTKIPFRAGDFNSNLENYEAIFAVWKIILNIPWYNLFYLCVVICVVIISMFWSSNSFVMNLPSHATKGARVVFYYYYER